MNLIILEDHHFKNAASIELSGRYHAHITQVLRCNPGDTISVGRLNGLMGQAEVSAITSDKVHLTLVSLDQEAPPTLPLTLILALPRPRMLQRSLQTIATMGVQKLCLIQTQRVEKSYWHTPLLQADNLHQQVLIGLEQARATQLPEISFHQRFKPFAEDYLPTICPGKSCLIAHPGNFPHCSSQPQTDTVLAIGPEGGFIPYELELFEARGFTPVQLGRRILRVETAIPALISRLFY